MSINRRKFIEALAIAGVIIPTTALAQEDNNDHIIPNDKFDFLVPAYLQNHSEKGFSIFSILNKPGFAWIEILDNNNDLVSKIFQEEDGEKECTDDYDRCRNIGSDIKSCLRICSFFRTNKECTNNGSDQTNCGDQNRE